MPVRDNLHTFPTLSPVASAAIAALDSSSPWSILPDPTPQPLFSTSTIFQNLLNLGAYLTGSAPLLDKVAALGPFEPEGEPEPFIPGGACYASETDMLAKMPIDGCLCHASCAKCGYYAWPDRYKDCIECAAGHDVTVLYTDGTGTC